MNKIATILCLALTCLQVTHSYVLMCYYNNDAQYRHGNGKYFIGEDAFHKCTHIVYVNAILTDNILLPNGFDEEQIYTMLSDLKMQYPSVKTLIEISSWNLNPGPFARMAASPQSRQEFVKSVLDFLLDYKFDGINLDWEYPTDGIGSTLSDKEMFTQLLSELKLAFQPYDYLLIATVANSKSVIDSAYNFIDFVQYLDYVNLITFDLASIDNFSKDGKSVAPLMSPLYARSEIPEDTERNQNWIVNYWLSKNIPKEKLLLGIAMYGRTYELREKQTGLSEPLLKLDAPLSDIGKAEKFTEHLGLISYYELCSRIRSGKWQEGWDTETSVPYGQDGNLWVTFENNRSVTAKVQYAQNKGLGGIWVYTLDFDDFDGYNCNAGTFPLLTSIYDSLFGKEIIE